MEALNSWSCLWFLLVAFTLAGVAQTIWLKSGRLMKRPVPLDGGRTFRGRRLLGDNKTWRGFVVMIPASGLAFLLLAGFVRMAHGSPREAGLWDLPLYGYGLLGLWTGLGFMAGELPNSFLKRQLDVAPGGMPRRPFARVACFICDRCDSILGLLIALSLVVPTTWQIWVFMLLIGAAVHWVFNLILFVLRVKPRPA